MHLQTNLSSEEEKWHRELGNFYASDFWNATYRLTSEIKNENKMKWIQFQINRHCLYTNHKVNKFNPHLVMKKTRDENLPREAGDSIAIASLAYPPQLAWMPDNGQLPYQGYRNNLEKIDWLNSRIRQLNSDYNSLNPPCFHTYGVRKSTRTKVDRFGQVSVTPSWLHRWDHWLVSDPAEMLHLTNERRIKMGVAINNYFKINTLN